MKTNHIDAASVARRQRHARNLAMMRRVADAATQPSSPPFVYNRVVIHDMATDERWAGWVRDGMVYDRVGFIDGRDIPHRFHILRAGVDVSDEFAVPA